MKKSTYIIQLNNGPDVKNKAVNGLTNKFFGVHFGDGAYCVTHLNTGLLAGRFKKQKDAREFAEILDNEDFPVSWDTANREVLEGNSQKTLEIRDKIKMKEETKRRA